MNRLTLEQRIQIVEWFIREQSVSKAQRIFCERYAVLPSKAPTAKTIRRLVNKFRSDAVYKTKLARVVLNQREQWRTLRACDCQFYKVQRLQLGDVVSNSHSVAQQYDECLNMTSSCFRKKFNLNSFSLTLIESRG
jgi:hypothetical protein